MTRLALRVLIALFPRPLRREHGVELLDQLDRDRRATRGLARAGFWVRTLIDVPVAAARARRTVPPPSRLPSRHPRATSSGGVASMNGLLHDLRAGARMALGSPLTSTVVVLTLATAIGLNTAIYSAVDRLLIHPISHPEADRLVHVSATYPKIGVERRAHSGGVFHGISAAVTAFDRVGAIVNIQQNLTGIDVPAQIEVGWVNHQMLEMVGVVPALGRMFQPDDAPEFIVVDHALWTTAFTMDPGIVGRAVELDGIPYTVIGVLPAGFELQVFPSSRRIDAYKLPDDRWANGDLWEATGPEYSLLRIVGRLAPGSTLHEAQQQLDAYAAALLADTDVFDASGMELFAEPLRDYVAADVRDTVTALSGAVLLLLLIACANVMNLMLVRTRARWREVSLRLALGAPRGRVLRMLLCESLLLALAGGGLGLVVGQLALRALRLVGESSLPRLTHVGLDASVLAFAAAVTLGCPLLFGVAPAMGTMRRGARADLGSTRTTETRGGRLLSRWLVVVQLALSLVLLIGTGLMIASLLRLQAVDPGFENGEVLTFSVSLPGARYEWPAGTNRFFREFEERIETLPGVISAGTVWPMPLSGANWDGAIAGGIVAPADGEMARYVLATPDYFDTARIPFHDGRTFADDDPRESVIVSALVAALAWPGESPIGRTLSADPWGRGSTEYVVVGVVGDVRQGDLRAEPSATVYFDARGWSWVDWEVDLMVRSETAAGALVAPIREILLDMDAEVPMAEVRELREVVAALLAPSRFAMSLLGTFAAAALLAAALGLYGVISYTVSNRTRELGIRMALGSGPTRILGLVLGQGLRMTIAGLTLGLLGAWGLTRYLSSFLYGVSATDPGTYAGVSLLLLAVATIASLVPARRATSLDPARVLRSD